MALPTMTVTQQYTITLKPKTKPSAGFPQGKDATVDGDPTWATSNDAVAQVVPNPGTLSCLIVAQGVGSYSISASVDADLGPGVTTLTFTDDGTATQGTAASVGAEFSPVEEQP